MQRSLRDEVKYLEGKLSKNENSVLFARLADAYLQMDRVDEAIALCEKGIKKHPYYVTGHYMLGKCYLRKKLFDQAEKELKRVLLFDPKHIAAHRDYAELMAQIGWVNTSERSFEEILRIDPLNQAAKQRLEELRSSETKSPGIVTPTAEKEIEAMETDLLTELEETDKPASAVQTPSRPVGGDRSETSTEPLFEPELDVEPDTEAEFGFDSSKTGEITPLSSHSAHYKPPMQQPTPQEPKQAGAKRYFEETESTFEDESANLDLLEDIFRDDELPDLLGEDEELVGQFEQSEIDSFGVKDGETDRMEEVSEIEDNGEFDTNELEGLADEDVFALMTGDEDRIQFAQKAQEPGEEASRRSDRVPPEEDSTGKKFDQEAAPKAKTEDVSPLKKTLEEIQKQTRPRFEPPAEPPTPSSARQRLETSEPEDKNDSLRRKEKIVTPTLGEIYAAQHQYAKAIGVYEILRKKDPNNEFYKQKIEYLQKKLEESQSES